MAGNDRENPTFRLKSRDNISDGLTVSNEPIPEVSKHEVLIRIRAVTLNYRDLVISNSKYPFPVKDNVVPCSDGAGDVVSVGEAVQTLAPGDRVIGNFDVTNMFGPQKNWNNGQGGPVDGVLRRYVALPESVVVKVPKDGEQSYAEWASLVCTGVTSWNALFGNIPLKPGQTVLFQGTGGVSITGLILARACGARTIITSSSDEKLRLVQSKFGADETINYKTHPDWASEALKLTDGRGVDFILENGGAGTIKASTDAIAQGGVIAIIGFLAPCAQDKMPDVASLALAKGCVIRGINVGAKELLEDVVRLVGVKGLRLPIEKEFGFTRDQVLEAYQYLESGQHIGKIAIIVD